MIQMSINKINTLGLTHIIEYYSGPLPQKTTDTCNMGDSQKYDVEQKNPDTKR